MTTGGHQTVPLIFEATLPGKTTDIEAAMLKGSHRPGRLNHYFKKR